MTYGKERPSDDPYHRIRCYAENRAKLNNRDPAECGRRAMALYRLVAPAPQTGPVPLHVEGPNIEAIVSAAAGEHPRNVDGTLSK